MNYAKQENGTWIEVRGNGVAKAILDTLGFVPLQKFDGTLQDNQYLIIEKIGDICKEIVITKEYYVKFGSQDPVAINAKTKAFLEAYFMDALIVDEQGRTRKNRWRIGNAELKRMRKLVWERWEKYVGDFVVSKVTSDDENADDGVSFNDLVLHSFFDGNWPIQNKNGKTKLGNAAINRIKGEIRDALIAKREAVELACIPVDSTGPVLLTALDNSALWVLDGVA
jgi:hypothetical protein